MAAGRVCTGFSKPYVALYDSSNNAITYTSGQVLARGVDVNIEPDSADDNNFYADNQTAETAAGGFTGGTVTLTIDGLLMAAEKLIMGLPAPGEDGFTAYDDDQKIPYVGIGFICRYMSSGTISYVPTVLVKTAFNQIPTNASTQEEEIDWQTQELTATIMRGDDAKHTWKYQGEEYPTEAAAEAKLRTKLGISG